MPNISSMPARYRTSHPAPNWKERFRAAGKRAFRADRPSKHLHGSNPAAFDEAKSPEAAPADGF
jgi:hypothetical protein